MFEMRIYTAHDPSADEVAKSLWDLLSAAPERPLAFDRVEKARRKFGSWKAAAELFAREQTLVVTGTNGFIATFAASGQGLAHWYFSWRLSTMDVKGTARWCAWIAELCSQLPPLFALGCQDEEYRRKHDRVVDMPNGGRVTSSEGVSTAEFYRVLPGVYWLTVFGEELVKHFGREALDRLDAQKLDVGSDQMALRLSDTPCEPALEIRIAKEQELVRKLGASYFFDIDTPTQATEPVPALQRTLEAMGEKAR